MAPAKTEWITTYASRVLNHWQQHPGHIEVSNDYLDQIRTDLETQYDDPLKRSFVESMWPASQ